MDDLISRQAAIDTLKDLTANGTNRGMISGEDAVHRIEMLPPAQPEQRTGKWIPQDHNKRAGNISTCVYYYPTCSECGKVGIETYKYCPHCGAKMISEGKTCDCYRDGTCIGTKEIDSCSCGGVKSKCDFYEHVRWEGDAE